MLASHDHHQQLFIKLENTSGKGIKCGYFSISDHHKVHSHFFENNFTYLFKELTTLHAKGDKNQILVFIHGMWGNKKRYLHKNIIDFQKCYLDHPSANLFAIVWILWDGGHLRYKKNQACMHNLHDVSNELLALLYQIKENLEAENQKQLNLHLMAHSMGCVLVNHLSSVSQNAREKPVCKSIMLVAPDMDLPPGKRQEMAGMSKSVFIFVNRNDFFLKLSRYMNGRKPIGLDVTQASPHECNIIDVSEIKDHASWVGRLSGHLYFRTSETVKNKIMDILISN